MFAYWCSYCIMTFWLDNNVVDEERPKRYKSESAIYTYIRCPSCTGITCVERQPDMDT